MHEKEQEMKKSERSGYWKDGPDGSLAWIVALAACEINFIMAGLSRISGILFVAFIEEYQVDRKSASTPFSVRSAVGNLLGPVVGILGQKYGIRTVVVTGGIVGTLSAACCFYADDINWITFLWGGLSGAGSALTIVLPQVSIGEYFQEYRTTASGIAFSGGCFGSFVFPAFLEHFLEESGIEGTFLIMAAVIANTIPAAMILRRPPWKKTPKNNLQQPFSLANKAKVSNCKDSDSGSPCCGKERPDVGFLRHNSDLVVRMLNLKAPSEKNQLAVPWQDPASKYVSALEVCIGEELEDMFRCLQFSGEREKYFRNLRFGDSFEKPLQSPFEQRTMHTDTKFKYGLGKALFRASSAPDVSKMSKEISAAYVLQKMLDLLALDKAHVWACFPAENRRKVYRLLKEIRKLYNANARRFGNRCEVPKESPCNNRTSSVSEEAVFEESHRNGFSDHVRTAFRLHMNPLFMLICLCRAVHFVAFIPAMTTVVDFVMDKGQPEYQGKYAIAALSVGDLVGRLCLGWVTDRGYLPLPRYMLTVMVMQGMSTAALPLAAHEPLPLLGAFALFGLLQGSLFVRHPVLVAKYMLPHEQSIAMGCVSFLSGLLGFGVPYYIGYFRDTLGSYDYIFYINGMMGALIGLLWALEPYLLRRASGKHSVCDDTV